MSQLEDSSQDSIMDEPTQLTLNLTNAVPYATFTVHMDGQHLTAQDAFQRLVHPSVKMGSKSTATLLLYALHYAMGCESTEPMLGLIQKTQGAPSDFARKVAYRLLASRERNDHLKWFVHRLCSGWSQLSHNRMLSHLHAFRLFILATVDVRRALLLKHLDVIVFLLQAVAQDEPRTTDATIDVNLDTVAPLEADSSETTPNGEAPLPFPRNGGTGGTGQTSSAEVTEMVVKAVSDVLLFANCDHLASLPPIFFERLQPLLQTTHAPVLDASLRLLSYLLHPDEAQSADPSTVSSLSAHVIEQTRVFSTLLQHLNDPLQSAPSPAARTQQSHLIQLTTLQHLATHLLVHLPRAERPPYLHALDRLRHHPNPAVDNYALRCLHILSSTGLRTSIAVLYAESIDTRRQKQLEMFRRCEGCALLESAFGRFLMCAGCRKVRYCSKACQVRDWKYHRMACHFFRPRPGFRSRGTQTAVDVQTQTGDSDGVMMEGVTEKGEVMEVVEGGKEEGEDEESRSETVGRSVQTDVSFKVDWAGWCQGSCREWGCQTD